MPLNNIILTAIAFSLTISATVFGSPTQGMPAPSATPAQTATPTPSATPVPAPTPPLYTLTEIAPGKGFHGQHMNALGEICGTVDTATPGINHAAIYRDGKITDLGARINPALDSFASFVNLFGAVSVEAAVPRPPINGIPQTELFIGFIYFDGILFPIPKFPKGASLNQITSLNDFGQFVGNFIDPTTTNGGEVSGFLDQPIGVFVKLPIIPMGRRDINNVGQILGDNRTPGNDAATILQPGGELIPVGFTSASAINQLGHVCGWDSRAQNVFLFANGKANNLGHLTAFPPLDIPGGNFTFYFAEDINNLDIVIGEVEGNIPPFGTRGGFVFEPLTCGKHK